MNIEINLPSSYIFETTILIRIDDINYGNHLGNDVLLAYAHETRVQFLNELGYTELNIDGTGIIMTESAVKYLAEGHHGQTLNVKLAIEKTSDLVLGCTYVFTESQTKKEVARVFTKLVSFDYDRKKVRRFSSQFLNQLNS